MSLFRGKSAPSARIFLAAFFFCIAIFWTLSRIQYHTETDADRNGEWSLAKSPPDKAFVVASQRHENTSWLVDGFPDWHKYIYVVNDPYAGELTVERNKGRESMVYLSFIIDNYHRLPANIVFLHASRYQWHNDDPDYDGLHMLQKFRIPYLHRVGYTSLRCAWVLGCPAELHPIEDAERKRPPKEAPHAGHYYKKIFPQLFPGRPVPEVVGASCCAQFAVTRETVRQRRKEEYERIRNWLLKTNLDDSISGRIIEYSWHILFNRAPVHCPTAQDCYCNVYGMCNATCTDEACQGRYQLPPYSDLPQGWPKIGWNGEPRNLGIPG